MKRFCFALVLVVLFAAFTPSGWAQSVTGSISGSVRDAAGASVPAAKVVLKNTATGGERSFATGETGDFVFAAVEPGEYRLTITAQGFRTLERPGINLTASERLAAGTFTLAVGAVEERVTVTAQTAPVQTVSSERSAAITSSQVENLLIRGRNVTALMSLLPGVVDPAGNAGEQPTPTSMTNFNVNGGRSNSNNMTVDGLHFVQTGGSPNGYLAVSMDSVSEVKVLLSNYQAEYGRLSGATIQVVTRSGSRDFHGGVSYFKRHEQFNANNFFSNRNGLEKGRYRYNTTTYNIGGPIYIPGKFNTGRDKLFFFWNHEYWPRKTTSALNYATFPTELERAGNFSQSVDVNGARIPVTDPLTRQPFPNNIVPANRLDANGLSLLKIFPQPNALDTAVTKRAYNNVSQWGNNAPLHLPTLKVDYSGGRDNLAFTWAGEYQTTAGGNVGGITAPFRMINATQHAAGHLIAVRHQRIFSPTAINELTVGHLSRFTTAVIDEDSLPSLQRNTYGFTAGQINPSSNPGNYLPEVVFGGIPAPPNISYTTRFPNDNWRRTWNVSDNFTLIRGPHSLKAGIFFDRMAQGENTWGSNFAGRFDFGRNVNNPLDSNYTFANAALGNFNTYNEISQRVIMLQISRGFEWFVQDNWRVNRRLTLDYGVRFQWFEPFWAPDMRMTGFVPGRYDPNHGVQLIRPAMSANVRVGMDAAGRTYPAVLIGAIAPGSGDPRNGTVVVADDKDYPRGLIDTPGILAAPRFGFSFDPLGNGKTAIRGGAGVFYNRLLSITGNSSIDYPLTQTPQIQYGTIATFRSAQGFLFPPSVQAFERDMKTSRVVNLSLSVQRDIGWGTTVDVGYAGSLGRHLLWSRDLQAIPMGANFDPRNADPTNPRVPLPTAFLRPIQGYNGITYNEAAASSNYHSLQVSANRRFSRSFDFGFAWTWSKALDYVDDDLDGVNTLVSRRVWSYGPAGFDRTHVAKINWVWDLPTRSWQFAPLRPVLNGWQISGIATFSSGAPVTPGFAQVTAKDITGTPSLGARMVLTGDPSLPKGERTFSRNFRTDVFQMPAVGTIGNLQRNLLRQPGINNWDIALFKSFPIRERCRIQFRSEFYNAFNHTQFSAFDATARFDANGRQVNARFGEFTAARTPRIIQLSIRARF